MTPFKTKDGIDNLDFVSFDIGVKDFNFKVIIKTSLRPLVTNTPGPCDS